MASTIGSLDVTMLIELGVLSAILILFGNMVLPWLPVVIVLVAIETVFVLGIALALSVWNVYFRRRATPRRDPHAGAVLHVPDRLPGEVRAGARAHRWRDHPAAADLQPQPVGALHRLLPRTALYNLRFPPLWDVTYILLWAIGMFAFGMWMFGKLDRRLAEEV